MESRPLEFFNFDDFGRNRLGMNQIMGKIAPTYGNKNYVHNE